MADEETVTLNSEIYEILERCTSDELAPLAEMLCGVPGGILRISRAFERFQPDHARYHDRIGDEVYRLSLKTIKPEEGKRPSYPKMVHGVCKQIGMPHMGGWAASEDVLLNMFSDRHWNLISEQERRKVIVNASTKVAAAAKTWSLDDWQPFAGAFLHVAFLRRRLNDQGRLHPVSGNTVSKIGTHVDVLSAAEGDRVANCLSFQDEGSVPPIREGDSTDAGWRTLEADSSIRNSLQSVAKALQPVVAGSQILGGEQLWRVSAEGTAHIIEGGHKGMRHLSSVSVAQLLGPTVVLSVAAAMLEQSKLDEIDRKLAAIRETLKDLANFQSSERRSVVTGSLRYFQQIAVGVLSGELAGEVLNEIERHEAELVRVQEHLDSEVRGRVTTIQSLKKDVKAIQTAQDELDRLCQDLLLCLRARASGFQLLNAFPGRDAGKRARLKDIESGFASLSPTGEIVTLIDEAVRGRLQDIPSISSRASLLAKENALLDRMKTRGSAALNALRLGKVGPSDSVQLQFIDLKVVDGQLSAIRIG